MSASSVNNKMKIAVFFDAFEPYHLKKDPGQIVLGLNEAGVCSEMITLKKDSLKEYDELPLKKITEQQARDIEFWKGLDYEVIIAYTWLRNDYYWVPEILKRAGKKVIVKCDTDGRYNYPLYPRWDTYIPHNLKILSFLKILRRRFKRRWRGEEAAGQLAQHIEMVDGVVVESPQAQVNVSYILHHWGRGELTSKLHVIHNPVESLACKEPLAKKKKQIVAIGSWETKFGDYYVKNTQVMCKVIARFLRAHPDYHAVIIGSGSSIVTRIFSEVFEDDSRLQIVGSLDHCKVIKCLSQSNILFVPSISESWGIAAAEALSLGCSIVASPLESLNCLSQGGLSGTLAPTFNENAFLAALTVDALKWERGEYSPEKIRESAIERFNRKEIIKQFCNIAEQLNSKKNG